MKFIIFLIFSFFGSLPLALSNEKQNDGLQKDIALSFKGEAIKSRSLPKTPRSSQNKVELTEAIQMAVKHFNSDFDEGNQTPLDIIFDQSYEKAAMLQYNQGSPLQFAKHQLKALLFSKETSFVLVNNNRVGEQLGFNPFKNWVFELKVPSLQGFTFWCVISKFRDEEPLTFGEN